MSGQEIDRGLETLLAWQKAMQFAVNICRELLAVLPAEEKFALKDQLRRSAQSVLANIAEGYGRYYYQEAIRFCYMARGSLDETRSHLYFAHQMHYINDATYKQYQQESEALRKILNGYIAYIKKTKRGATEPGAFNEVHEEASLYQPNYDEELSS